MGPDGLSQTKTDLNLHETKIQSQRRAHDGLGKLFNSINRLEACVCNLCAVRKSFEREIRCILV